MHRKGVLAGILTLALVLCLAATGWAGGGKEPSGVPTISLMAWGTEGVSMLDNTPVQQWLENKYGVKFSIVRIPGDDSEVATKFAALVAAGDLPDVIYATGGTITAEALHAQDAIGPIDPAMFKKYAPKTYAQIEADGKTYNYDPWYSSTFDGKLYGFHTNPVHGLAPDNVYLRGWRMDLLQKIGINKVPETLDDMEAIGKAQVASDPSIYMLSGPAKNGYFQFATDIFNAFAFMPEKWVYWNGKFAWSSTLPEFKQAVAFLADWYKKGYIDPEYLTTDYDNYDKKWANGKLLSYTWAHIVHTYPQSLGGYGYYNKLVQDQNPNALVVPSPWVKGPTGRAVWNNYSMWAMKAQHIFSKKMAADPLKMQKYFQVLEGKGFDQDTSLTMSYGIKGKDWNVDSNGVLTVTSPNMTPQQQDALGNTRLWMFAFHVDRLGSIVDDQFMQPDRKKVWAWADAFLAKYPYMLDPKNRYPDNLPIVPFPADVDKAAQAARPIMQTAINAIIMGTQPLSTFDDAVTQWLAAGGQAATDWINAHDMKFVGTVK